MSLTREDIAAYLAHLPVGVTRKVFGIEFKKVHESDYKMRPDTDYIEDRIGHNGAAEYLLENRYAFWNI